MRAGKRQHKQTGDYEGGALAQHQVGVLHGSGRSRPHPGAENWFGGNTGIRGGRGPHPGSAHAARLYPQHHQPVRHGKSGNGDVGK